jgi:adenylate cyclase
MKKGLLLISLVLLSVSAQAQKTGPALVDSLVKRLSWVKEDTNKVILLLDISFYAAKLNPKKTIHYGNQALALSKKLEYPSGEAGANRNIGMGYGAQSLYVRALQYYFKSLRSYEELDDQMGMAKVKLSIGLVHTDQKDYENALKYLKSALKDFEELDLQGPVAKTLNNIGNVYAKQNQSRKAMDYYQQALSINEASGNIADGESNISNIAACAYELLDYDKAIEYYNKALVINEQTGNQLFRAVHISGLGNVYKKMVFLNAAAPLKKYFQGSTTKALQTAKRHIEDGITLYTELGDLNNLYLAYKDLSEIQELLGDTEGSLASFKQFALLRDSVFNEANTKKLVTMEMQFDFDKKEAVAKKELQHAKWVSNGFIGGFSVMLLFAIVFLYQRNRIRKGKKRSDDLLLNILPEEVAEELKLKGASDARQYDEVSILFTDFKGFTQLSEKMNPRDLVAEIDHCFRKFDEIITKYDIEKIKTIGDAYMAVSGLPVESPEHAMNMVSAALEIRDFMEAYKAERLAENKLFFEIRIGIHTGEVVAGIVGVKKFAYDIWGDAVNTAARMESSGEVGKVNISETTYQLVKSRYDCTFRGEIEAKGKGKVNMYFVEYQH